MFQVIRENIDAVAGSVHAETRPVRLLVMSFVQLLISPTLGLIPSENGRHLYSTIIAIMLAWTVFEWRILHSLGTSIVGYLLLRFWPRASVGKAICALSFSYLLLCHIYREFYVSNVAFDCPQMILTFKLTALGINWSDGAANTITAKNNPSKLKQLPSILQYMGYLFFFPTFFAGPVFEFRSYLEWMKERQTAPIGVHLENISRVVISLAGLGLSEFVFPVKMIDSPDFFPQYSTIARALLMGVAVMFYRFRFYLVWSLGETNAVLAGAGRNFKTKKWDELRNCHILLVELGTSMRVSINSWNLTVARWLNTYVYKRVGLDKNGKPGPSSTLATFFVSALWHGLSTGYYSFFITGFIYVEVAKHIRRRFRSYFHYTEDRTAHPYAIFLECGTDKAHPLAVLYDLGGVALTWALLQYIGIAFELLDTERYVSIWKSVYFLPHILPLGLWFLFITFPQRKSPKKTN